MSYEQSNTHTTLPKSSFCANRGVFVWATGISHSVDPAAPATVDLESSPRVVEPPNDRDAHGIVVAAHRQSCANPNSRVIVVNSSVIHPAQVFAIVAKSENLAMHLYMLVCMCEQECACSIYEKCVISEERSLVSSSWCVPFQCPALFHNCISGNNVCSR